MPYMRLSFLSFNNIFECLIGSIMFYWECQGLEVVEGSAFPGREFLTPLRENSTAQRHFYPDKLLSRQARGIVSKMLPSRRTIWDLCRVAAARPNRICESITEVGFQASKNSKNFRDFPFCI